jgi:hypothetical protein
MVTEVEKSKELDNCWEKKFSLVHVTRKKEANQLLIKQTSICWEPMA